MTKDQWRALLGAAANKWETEEERREAERDSIERMIQGVLWWMVALGVGGTLLVWSLGRLASWW